MPRTVDAQQLHLDDALVATSDAREDARSLAPATDSRRSQAHPVPASDNHDGPRESGHAASRPSAAELLDTPGALLTRSHLRGLGLERRAIDAVFRALPVVELPGYSRPMIRAEEFAALVEHCTYCDDRVRPCHA
jgi:hypothetical protein